MFFAKKVCILIKAHVSKPVLDLFTRPIHDFLFHHWHCPWSYNILKVWYLNRPGPISCQNAAVTKASPRTVNSMIFTVAEITAACFSKTMTIQFVCMTASVTIGEIWCVSSFRVGCEHYTGSCNFFWQQHEITKHAPSVQVTVSASWPY